jgi:hypothetical protein
MTKTEKRIEQLQGELSTLSRPEDRLLTYVQTRLAELAHLGGLPPWAPCPEHSQAVQAPDETLAPSPWHAPVEGEPA